MAIKSFLKIENTRIGMRNFAGQERQFNAAGKRNFCVFIPFEDAEALRADGWNIRYLEPRDPEDQRQPYLPVSVTFDYYPAEIWIVTSHNKTRVKEEDVKLLDWAEIQNVDLTVRPYNWEQGGKSGIKAYVKSMFVTIVEDELAEKYHNVPEGISSAPDSFDG